MCHAPGVFDYARGCFTLLFYPFVQERSGEAPFADLVVAVEILGTKNTLSGVADSASKSLGGLQGAADAAGKVLPVVAAGTAVLAAGLGSSIMAAIDAEGKMAGLNAVLASTKGVAGVSAQALTAHADALSRLTKFEDEAIIGAQTMLLTFTNVGQDVFPKATETILNMSQALGQDLQSSSIQLGKALNDPIAGVSALRRVGVQLTDEQEDLIKSFMAVGDIAGAQGVILSELETQFGGAAEAAGKTFGGQLTILKNQLGNVQEEIGGVLLPILRPLVDALLGLANKFFGLSDETKKWIAIGGLVAFGLGTVLTGVLALVAILPTLMAGLTAAGTLFTITAGILTGPVLLAIAAVVGAIALLTLAWTNNWGDIQGKTAAVWEFLQPIFDLIQFRFAQYTEQILPELAETWAAMTNKISEVMEAVGIVVGRVLTAIAAFWTEHETTIMRIVTFLMDTLGHLISTAMEYIAMSIRVVLAVMRGDWQGAWDAITEFMSHTWNRLQAVFSGALELIAEGLGNAWAAIRGAAAAAWAGIVDTIAGVFRGIIGHVQGIIAQVMGLIQPVLNTIETVRNFRPPDLSGAIADIGRIAAGAAAGIPGRALGGPVTGGSPYLVGERGPELFVPGRSGGIVPNHALGSVAVYVTVEGSVQTEQDLVRAIGNGLKDLERRGWS